jgi:putative spermidine/putrescine transport system permease protein
MTSAGSFGALAGFDDGASGPGDVPGAGGIPAPTWRARLFQSGGRKAGVLGLLPFALYAFLFLGLPTLAIIFGAFQNPAGGFTWHNIYIASHGVYRIAFENSLKLALLTAVVPGTFGIFLAYAVLTGRRATLRRMVSTASGVFANFGGVPLAFLFIALLGTTGLLTNLLGDLRVHLYSSGFSLYTFGGVAIVYGYFQIPLMVLVITPALEGLRPAWREAASGLGARSWQYWFLVGGPVLLPSILGAMLLLFGSALSAYATAEVLTSGSIALAPILIGSTLNGNVLAGDQNVGKALGLGLVLIIAVAMIIYTVLQRRASRWLR